MKYSIKVNRMTFHVERNYDWKAHRPIYQIWRYDPQAYIKYRAMTWPFADCPNFDSFIQAVKWLKENAEELV